MAMGNRKKTQDEENRRLDRWEEEEARRSAPPENCVFCSRPVLHDMNESARPKGRWEKKFEGKPVCLQCHTQLHRLHKNRELARTLLSVESVLNDPTFHKYVVWARKLPPETLY